MKSLRGEILSTWLTDKSIQDLKDGEIEAIIDALTLAIQADFEASEVEEEEFSSLLMALPQASDLVRRTEHIKRSRDKAAQVSTAEALSEYVHHVASRLSEGIYERVYSMVVTLVVADRELSPDEEVVLEAFAEEFDISAERSKEIFEGTLSKLGLKNET